MSSEPAVRKSFLPASPSTTLFILVVALIHGLLYVILVPPWQHYDEPNHFEYVWLIAHRRILPAPGDADLAMRDAVAASMREHGFFSDLGVPPPALTDGEPAWIGSFPQLDEPPLYYLAAALPVGLLPPDSVDQQLYVARLVSLGLLLVTVFIASQVAGELTPAGHPLRLLMPLTVALLPGFVDLMTSVNNDVGAVALFSLFFWGCLRLLHRGFSWPVLLWTGITAAISPLVKSTALLSLPLLLLLLLFLLIRALPRPSWGWVGLAALLLAALPAGLLQAEAAFWYRAGSQTAPSRAESPQASHGEFALQVDHAAGRAPAWMAPFTQPLPQDTVQALRARKVTLAGWMWASAPTQARTPTLSDGNLSFFSQVEVDTSPRFFGFHADLPPDLARLWVALDPEPVEDVLVYFDGLVLVGEALPLDDLPASIELVSASQNLLRNPSGEAAWPAPWPALDTAVARLLPDNLRPSLMLYSLLDPAASGWYYQLASRNIFRTFWAQFGWGQVPLKWDAAYLLPTFLTGAGLIGAGSLAWRRRGVLKGDTLIWLGIVLFSVWGAALARGTPTIFSRRVFIPVARYAMPTILPATLILAAGWHEALRPARRLPRISATGAVAAVILILTALDALAIFSLISYFR